MAFSNPKTTTMPTPTIGIVLHGHVFANRLKVHQRHDASENRFCRAGKNVYDQVSAKRTGDSEKRPIPQEI